MIRAALAALESLFLLAVAIVAVALVFSLRMEGQ